MQNIKTCQKVVIPQGVFYLGESTEKYSQGYIELKPFSSLDIHQRTTGFENLTQMKGECVIVVFNKPQGKTYLLKCGDKLRIAPIGTWHIHSNPFPKISLTHWYFKGDIRQIIEKIRSR